MKTGRWIRVGGIVLAVVLCAELTTRLFTYLLWRAPLRRHPQIALRLDREGRAGILCHPDVFVKDPSGYRAPIFEPDRSMQPPRRWTTFGALTANDFRSPPGTARPASGTVRIVFLGGSTTFDGYPEQVQALLDRRFGPGRVEVINLGVPASWSATSLVIARRFLPRWHPHIVVVYHGFNDLLYNALRRRTVCLLARDPDPGWESVLRQTRPARGILDLLGSWLYGDACACGYQGEGFFDELMQHQHEFAVLARTNGFELVLSTFAGPDPDLLDEPGRDMFQTEFAYLWPVLGDLYSYHRGLRDYNRALRRTAAEEGVRLIDVAAVLRGAPEVFRDICHRTEKGRMLHAQAVANALADRVQTLLASTGVRDAPGGR